MTGGTERIEETEEIQHSAHYRKLCDQLWDAIPDKHEKIPGEMTISVDWGGRDD